MICTNAAGGKVPIAVIGKSKKLYWLMLSPACEGLAPLKIFQADNKNFIYYEAIIISGLGILENASKLF